IADDGRNAHQRGSNLDCVVIRSLLSRRNSYAKTKDYRKPNGEGLDWGAGRHKTLPCLTFRVCRFSSSTERETTNAERETISYPLISPRKLAGFGLNPGNIRFRFGAPICLAATSENTSRKSVVSARSRPSFNCSGARPGHLP